jgi:hypothetical protein
MNDERHKEDTLTNTVLQEALLNMPLGVCWNARLRALPSGVFGLQVPFIPQVDPVPPTIVSEQDEGTASLQ